jgi:phosphatidylserine decarboxylase
MILFGSRTDCYMPRGTEVTVRVGETVRGGQTVIGVLK